MFAGVRLAIRDINNVGGVLGKPVSYADGDDGTNPDVANRPRSATSDGVQVIIGAGASGITKVVLPSRSPPSCCSRRATRPPSSAPWTTGLLPHRPTRRLQAAALTNLIMRDGVASWSSSRAMTRMARA
jgi:ABC-type branched-subunit amino acid transport system substrate-binding protein